MANRPFLRLLALGALALGLAAGCAAAPLAGPDGCVNVQGSCKSVTGCVDYAGYDTTSLSVLETGCGEMNGTWAEAACDPRGAEGGCVIVAGDICVVAWAFPPTVAKTAQQSCADGADGNMWITPPP